MKNFLVTALIMLTIAGCATPKKPTPQPTPTELTVTLTPQELADAFEYRDQKIYEKLLEVEKRIVKLKAEIKKMVEDCLCPAEMK
jgi:TolA-binding protein